MRIDESIRVHDKLLLIRSESSINRPWVEDEVESALERERHDGKLVLFPIRLDFAVIDTSVAWAAKLRRSRHIGEFTQTLSRGCFVTSRELIRLRYNFDTPTIFQPQIRTPFRNESAGSLPSVRLPAQTF